MLLNYLDLQLHMVFYIQLRPSYNKILLDSSPVPNPVPAESGSGRILIFEIQPNPVPAGFEKSESGAALVVNSHRNFGILCHLNWCPVFQRQRYGNPSPEE